MTNVFACSAIVNLRPESSTAGGRSGEDGPRAIGTRNPNWIRHRSLPRPATFARGRSAQGSLTRRLPSRSHPALVRRWFEPHRIGRRARVAHVL